MINFIKKYKAGIVIFVISFFFLFLSFYNMTNIEVKVNEQNAQISELNKKIEDLKNSENIVTNPSVNKTLKDLTGYDSDRFVRDKKKASKIFEDVLTWDSYKTYNEKRNKAKNDYKIDEDEQFLKDFMPYIEELKTAGYKGQGTSDVTNIIDTSGANMNFDSVKPMVYKIDGDVYHYIADIVINVVDEADAVNSAKLIAEYNTNKDSENINDLKVFYVEDF